jgi:hypothetical protein
VAVVCESSSPHRSYNTTETSGKSCKNCVLIKTLLQKVLTDLSTAQLSIELLQKEINTKKEGVSVGIDCAMNTQYVGDVGTKFSIESNQVHPSKLAMCAELEDLKCDMVELNQTLKTAERKTVKEALLAEGDILSVKVASLHGIIGKQTVNDTKWSDVVDGKHKKLSYTSHVNTYPIPVIKYHYKPPGKSGGCEILVNKSMGVRKLEKQCKKKITSDKKKHKIIITGDSHTRDCASEVKQIIDNTSSEVQGVVKLGSGLMTITKSAEDDIKETDKNRHGGSVGRHKGRGKK